MSKNERMMNVLKNATEFFRFTECKDCPIGLLCDETIKVLGYPIGCEKVFLAGVIAGLIDLDGKPIDGDNQ